jgi:hypothetical protein
MLRATRNRANHLIPRGIYRDTLSVSVVIAAARPSARTRAFVSKRPMMSMSTLYREKYMNESKQIFDRNTAL